MTDRPGALGQVASRIGALRVDIVSVEVHRERDSVVVDEFLLMVPPSPDGLVAMLRSEIEQVDGVKVEHVEQVDDGQINLTLTNLVWFELMTDDCDAAAQFYRNALGWRSEPMSPVGDQAYHLVFCREATTPVGGIVYSPRAARGTSPSGAVVYIGVADLDIAIGSFESAGGMVGSVTHTGDHSSAVVADPWGNRLGLWQS